LEEFGRRVGFLVGGIGFEFGGNVKTNGNCVEKGTNE
jgi:hypothetical protein